MKSVGETTTPEGTRVPQSFIPKELSEYTDTDKELIRLDTGLMLILTDSVGKEMSYQLMNCVSGKQMWDTINLIMEGTEDVQENRLDILTSQYESFRSLPGESITQVFEKYTKLLNELSMKGKTYPLRETNRKFMMTLPHHVEHKSSSIRERIDFTKMPLEMIYGKLKTYEMEQEQRVIIYGPGILDNKNSALARSAALVVNEPTTSDIEVQTSRAGNEVIIEAEMDSANLGADESDYYTLEELEQMEDKTMAYLAAKFSHIRFKRNPKYKFKGSTNIFQKSKYSPGTGFKGGYTTGMIDRSKSRCYNCNELGHFATECRKPRQARDKKDVYEKKDSYEDLKKENVKLKQQLETLSGKQKGKAYIAEGKSWDDTDSDEEEEYVNLALMADSSEESPQSSQVHILTTIDMSNSEYKKTVQDLSVELFNVHTSMLASEIENAKLVLKIKNLESKNEELMLVAVTLEDLKQRNEYLENKVKCNGEIETILRKQISDLDLKLNAYKNSALIAKEIIDTQTLGNKTAIGFDYSKKTGKKIVEFPVTRPAVKKNTPHILKNVDCPVFVKPFSAPFNEDDLIIIQEL
ncbi:CCHC-type domain-containing protein [Heracleum sosnowskyi]|uniref:CCHC-type domain-containing protein n=1 Tax=Heracleum sosnowskyi TaxID=360622 RepID=A0AAD8HD58_9APIA|nr:CCHC-type domain-containing protein [Heracleum sosnowskyi]